ncbi:hypothetical protein [Caulobacter hibisci]|uniref:Uncharacterized protein n=1 Tax=Caulobacter hibisci TaxID=2035993 RepID=A0ABS0T3Q4_9CAUL|nr:hypothetical protein [Caulobacter hibisci]MBI1686510.1 hypothetical protein [Caulobacter hibisci]
MNRAKATDSVAWRFRTPFPPEAARERLEAAVGGPDETRIGEVIGQVGLDWARIYRCERQGYAPIPLRMDWVADGEGTLVTCRMRSPSKRFPQGLAIGIAIIAAFSAWLVFGPLARDAGGLTAVHVILFGLWCLFLGGWGLYAVVFSNYAYRDERLLLIAHAQQALEGGPVEEVGV